MFSKPEPQVEAVKLPLISKNATKEISETKKLISLEDKPKQEVTVNPLTKHLKEKTSQLVQKLLALEKSDPTSLSELMSNNKTRDALNNLLKESPVLEKKKMTIESA